MIFSHMSALPFEELRALVLLNAAGLYRGLAKEFERGRTPREVLNAVSLPEGVRLNLRDASREINQCRQKGIRLLSWFDTEYPPLLRNIPHPPVLLYMKGGIVKGDGPALGVVGSRHPSIYGMNQAKAFSSELASAGLTIISGFARGIDAYAHEAALEIESGRTIAVLGCGLDVDYPRGHKGLFHRIEQRGALVSEYPLGTPPYKENFPKRNRIISGLSLGVLVVEAHSKSGSLITADFALEQGREVFAIPGSIESFTAKGTHNLIREGAVLADSPSVILEELFYPLKEMRAPLFSSRSAEDIRKRARTESKRPSNQFHSREQRAGHRKMFKMLKTQPLTSEELTRELRMAPHQLSGLLLELEIEGAIHKGVDGKFRLK